MDIKIEMECIGTMISSVEEGEHIATFRPVMGQSQNLIGPMAPYGEVQFKTRNADEAKQFQLRGRYWFTLNSEPTNGAANGQGDPA